MKVQRLIEKYGEKFKLISKDYPYDRALSELWYDIKQLDEPDKVQVPQFVADWIEHCRGLGYSLYQAMELVHENAEIKKWFIFVDNQDLFARAWLDGYIVEKEKKYEIKLLNQNGGDLYLVNQNANLADKYGHFSPVVLLFTKSTFFSEKCYKLTKKEVVSNGFGWVFDCPGIKIEEVDD